MHPYRGDPIGHRIECPGLPFPLYQFCTHGLGFCFYDFFSHGFGFVISRTVPLDMLPGYFPMGSFRKARVLLGFYPRSFFQFSPTDPVAGSCHTDCYLLAEEYELLPGPFLTYTRATVATRSPQTVIQAIAIPKMPPT